MENLWYNVKPQLSPFVIETVEKLGFKTMTPVQTATIPHFLLNKDVAVEAITGSGKTLAFIIPMLERLYRREQKWKHFEIGGLILTPTRELAKQIAQVLNQFLNQMKCPFKYKLLIGGIPIEHEINDLNKYGAQIIIATPGKLIDLMFRCEVTFHVALRSLEMLILDEADRLLEMGFEKTLNSIFEFLPKLRRTGLFSATMTKEVISLIRAGLRWPVSISVKDNVKTVNGVQLSTPKELTNFYKVLPAEEKLSYLISFLGDQGYTDKKYILFFLCCACVNYFSFLLERLMPSMKLFVLHGKLRKKRGKVLDKFREASSGILLCTDVMERGIDIPDIDWVIHFDPPTKVAAFVHRSGRTARSGHSGSSLTLLMPNEDVYVDFIQLNQYVKITPLTDNPVTLISHEKIRQVAFEFQRFDRGSFDKANVAFVSYIRAYQKHECSYILQVKDLDFAGLAKLFGLLFLPKMPEITQLKRKEIDFTPADIDFNSIPYRHEKTEEKRLANLKQYNLTKVWPGLKKPKVKTPSELALFMQAKQETRLNKSISQRKNTKIREIKKLREARQRNVAITPELMKELADNIKLIKAMRKKNFNLDEFEKMELY